MSIPVLNLITQEHPLTTSGATVGHSEVSGQFWPLVRVLQLDVMGALGEVDAAPDKPAYYS